MNTNNSDLENIFFQDLGAYVTTATHLNETRSNLVTKEAKIKTAKQLAKFAAALVEKVNADEDGFDSNVFLLNKVANTKNEDWTSFHDDIVSSFIKQASPLSAAGSALSLGFRGITPIVGAVPALAATAIPIAGLTVGGGAHVAERAMNEDSLDAEELKALIVKYKQLTAQLERDIAKKKLKLEKYVV